MFISKTLKFYKREDIQEEMLRIAEDREVAVRYENGGFGKRPDTLNYKSDILEYAKKGAISFHCSEERWQNPLQISTSLRPSELDELRKGWDLVLDIDCKLLEYSKIAALYTLKVLRHHDIKSITCKFSGNKGFHIAVPFESFPERVGGKLTKELFPDAPRRIAAYIKYLIKDPVSKAILKFEKNDFEKVVQKTGKSPSDIIRVEKNEFGDEVYHLNAEPFLDIDTILISSRHMFRMPYSFHEKSQLISVPINPDRILSFTRDQAKPENVKTNVKFLDLHVVRNEASKLLVQAFDFEIKEGEDSTKKEFEYEEISDAIPEQLFPPCIKKIFEGLEDGRKRAVFILTNFLLNVGWNQDQIKDRLKEWNKKNKEPLREVYIEGQVRYRVQQKKKILPPNCNNKGYYIDMGVCQRDALCRKVKNPAKYTLLKARELSRGRKFAPQK